ncbi:WD40/YVTN/BNR-like repeat-containing protein [Ideonella sp. YS5]|uniref:WD40/YVTN/BNR-like repeat-containing protein n=1 Tax=Ideonella sp. YS5 TaxID=3453714 RepID=UPI003EEC7320
MRLPRRRILQGASLCALAGTGLPLAWSAKQRPSSFGGGYEWSSVPFGAGGFVDGFLFHPKERGLLYVRTDIGGAYRFDTRSHSWVPLLDHLSLADADLMGVLSLAIDPQDPDRLYAACGLYLDERVRPAALLASTDRGATWQQHELGIHLGGNWAGRGSGERLQVDPRDGQVLWLGTSRDGLLKSTDRGRSFKPQGLAARHVSFVLIDPAGSEPGKASRTVYAGSHDDPGLYVSRDGGASFEREAATPRQAPQQAAFASDGSLYVTFAQGEGPVACNPSYARSGGVWKRTPDGRWMDITPELPGEGRRGFGYSAVDVDRQMPRRVVVSTIERWVEGDDIFLSEDGGANWTSVGQASVHDARAYPWLQAYMRTERRLGHWTSAVKLDPFDGQIAVYGTGYGVWMTHGLGAARRGSKVRWDFTVEGLEETATLEIRSPSEGPRLLAAMGDVAGAAWEDPERPPGHRFFLPGKETNRSVDFAELAPKIIARTSDGPSSGHWSDDGGASWRPFATSPRTERVQSGHVAVSAAGGSFLYAPKKGQALRSDDRGRSWSPCEGWPQSSGAELKPVADRTVEGVFHVLDRDRGQVLTSTDGGRRFEPSLTGLPRIDEGQWAQLLSAPGTAHELWLVLHDRLLHVAGRGQEPRRIEGVAGAWMMALGRGKPGAAYRHSLYLWGQVRPGRYGAPVEGVFRSDDGGASFQRINDDAHRYGRLLSMAADARHHGVVYLAPHGRGVVMGRPRAKA